MDQSTATRLSLAFTLFLGTACSDDGTLGGTGGTGTGGGMATGGSFGTGGAIGTGGSTGGTAGTGGSTGGTETGGAGTGGSTGGAGTGGSTGGVGTGGTDTGGAIGDGGMPGTGGEGTGGAAALSYAADIEPIILASCGGPNGNMCHLSNAPPEMLDLRMGNGYASLVGIPSEQVNGLDRVAAGNSSMSYLVNKLEGTGMEGQMPAGQGAQPLPPADIQLIKDWIDGGANP